MYFNVNIHSAINVYCCLLIDIFSIKYLCKNIYFCIFTWHNKCYINIYIYIFEETLVWFTNYFTFQPILNLKPNIHCTGNHRDARWLGKLKQYHQHNIMSQEMGHQCDIQDKTVLANSEAQICHYNSCIATCEGLLILRKVNFYFFFAKVCDYTLPYIACVGLHLVMTALKFFFVIVSIF